MTDVPVIGKPAPFIVDVSSNQVHPIDWIAVKEAGCVGVIVKATQGLHYVNPFFEEDVKSCVALSLPVMAYHFATFEPVKEEVAAFRKVAGARARALDIETSTNLGWATNFLRLIEKDGDLKPDQTMLYGSASTIPRKGVTSLLWIADYGQNPGQPCECWQYTQSGQISGIANAVDVSRWLGTQAQFDAFFGV